MIFGKDKKNTSTNDKNSVEDTAIDRWRSINNSQSGDRASDSQSSELPPVRRTSYLSSLINDDPTDTFSAAERVKQSITLEEEVDDSFLEEEEEDRFENESPSPITVLSLDSVLEEIEVVEPTTIEEIKKEPKIKIPSGDFSIDVEQDLTNRFGSNLKSALGEGTMIDGVFSFETPVKVDGTLTGEIRSESALIVGKNAQINAKIKVGSLVVIGHVEGEIEAEDLVEIRSSGSISGDIITKRISLEEGGLLNGSCTILD